MASDERFAERHKMTSTADLIRRGATLLNEACPRCHGVQIRFKGNVYCINEDNIDSILSAPTQSQPQSSSEPAPIVQPVTANNSKEPAIPTHTNAENVALRGLLEEKLAVISKQLEVSQDFDQQVKLLDLISKYLETLEKLKRANV